MTGWPQFAVWVHTPHPFLIRFTENIGVRYYGLAYLSGFAAAVWLLHRYHKAGKSPFGLNTIGDLMTYLIAGVLLGGRLGYFLLYHPGVLVTEPLVFFRVWEGGMASHGAFVGVLAALMLFARRFQVPFAHVSDLVVTTVPAGVMLGRIANYLNGELWGNVTTVPWGVIFARTGGGELPRHPSQLYEAALEGLVLLAWMQWRIWRSDVVRDERGRLTGEFLIGYAIVRIIGETFREPDAALIAGLTRGTFYSLFLALAGAIVIALARRRGSKREA